MTALMGLLLSGCALGSAAVCTGRTKILYFSDLLFGSVRNCMPEGIRESFYGSIKPLLMLLSMQFVLGFFAVGQPLEIMTVAVMGISAGALAASVYIQWGVKGAAVNSIMLVPFITASAFILITGARESIRMSSCFFSFGTSKSVDFSERPEIKLYCLRFGILMIFSAAVSAGESLVIKLLGGLL
jgi:hypothetical protein